MTKRILCVCLGNICRSPTAEAVLRAKAAERGIDIDIDSAGTGNWHIGKPPYSPMIETADAAGYDLTPLRARQVRPQDFHDFDLIFGMDAANTSDLNALDPGARATVAPFDPDRDVPDPYYTRDFEEALTIIEAAADRILDRF